MRAVLTASCLFTMPIAAQTPPEPGRLLTNFAGDGVSMRWNTVLDGVMGGRSSGSFRTLERTLLFEGTLNTNGGGFASIRTAPAKLELEGYEGIRVRVRGDGRTYSLRLQQSGLRRGVSYRAEFATTAGQWRDVWLPFTDFVPTWRGRILDMPSPDPARVEALGVTIADKVDGPFRIELDTIHAYARFTIEDYTWENRLLLVFAPDAADAQAKRQVAAVESRRAAFDDRDMALLRVFGKGRSFAEGRPLTHEAAAGLRKQFGVGEREFAVVLVGKDGVVKRRADSEQSLEDVFAQVDKMPMRRAEVQRRTSN